MPTLDRPVRRRRLAGDEGRAAGRAAVLGVVVSEHHAFFGDAIDVRRLVADQPVRVGADVGLADIVTEDDQDVRPRGRSLRRLGLCGRRAQQGNAGECDRRGDRSSGKTIAWSAPGDGVVHAVHDGRSWGFSFHGLLLFERHSATRPRGRSGSGRHAPTHEARRMQADLLADRRPAWIGRYCHSTRAWRLSGMTLKCS